VFTRQYEINFFWVSKGKERRKTLDVEREGLADLVDFMENPYPPSNPGINRRMGEID